MTVEIIHGDCIEAMRNMPDNSVDSIVTDPPYGLSAANPQQIADTMVKWATGERDYTPQGKGFMGKSWDAFVPPPALWDEALRVLKPGGHLLAFAGSRTQDLMGLSIRLAGFEIRESVCWLYGSGFPKSLDVSKAIDKAAGAERTEVVGRYQPPNGKEWNLSNDKAFGGTTTGQFNARSASMDITAPATPAAQQWEGWGTALKPAFEPVVVARKPFQGTVANNVQTWGTGALNINATRIEGVKGWPDSKQYSRGIAWGDNKDEAFTQDNSQNPSKELGRWPANVVLDETTAELLDQQTGNLSVNRPAVYRRDKADAISSPSSWEKNHEGGAVRLGYSDSGGASRFFKVAKSDEHGAISEHFPREFDAPFMYVAKAPKRERPVVDGVAHPTVKPLALMRWLVKLVTPPGGTVLEPFAGSGATVEACMLEGFNVIAIEQEADYLPLIQSRIDRQEEAA